MDECTTLEAGDWFNRFETWQPGCNNGLPALGLGFRV